MSIETFRVPIEVPLKLANRLSAAADRDCVPRGEHIVRRLEQSFFNNLSFSTVLIDCLGFPQCLRIQCSTVETDLRRLFLMLDNISISNIFVAARHDVCYGSVLVLLIQSQSNLFLMDATCLNASTADDKALIVDLFVYIERQGLNACLAITTEPVPDTRQLTAEEAVDCHLSSVDFDRHVPPSALLEAMAARCP